MDLDIDWIKNRVELENRNIKFSILKGFCLMFASKEKREAHNAEMNKSLGKLELLHELSSMYLDDVTTKLNNAIKNNTL